MKLRLSVLTAGALGVGLLIGLMLRAQPAAQGKTGENRAPRTADGKPNLNGVWQVMNTANWDIQDHNQRQGPLFQLGAAFSVPPGEGVVVGNEIPYQAAALAKKKENYQNRAKADPLSKCYLPGVPRVTYVPLPFEIVQVLPALNEPTCAPMSRTRGRLARDAVSQSSL